MLIVSPQIPARQYSYDPHLHRSGGTSGVNSGNIPLPGAVGSRLVAESERTSVHLFYPTAVIRGRSPGWHCIDVANKQLSKLGNGKDGIFGMSEGSAEAAVESALPLACLEMQTALGRGWPQSNWQQILEAPAKTAGPGATL